ncbi:MAG: hypothetical protein IAE97_00065 [Chthoniobacterales bacterium]|nr:hypothetical protein [Chthoniobacterales bacterium]
MLELLFVIGFLAWLVISALQYLAQLPASGTLSAAAIMIPLIACVRMRILARAGGLDFVRGTRAPVPPERFYWPLVRHRLGWRTALSAAVAGAVWPMAFTHPARMDAAGGSLGGWLAGATAIVTTAEAVAGAWLYVRASQRFNRLKPGFIGWMRRGLYRLSDNHEFLSEEPLPRQKREREAVY